jgi:hypothetical protein
MAIIDDFKGVNEALRRIQGRLPNLPREQEPTNAKTQQPPPPPPGGVPCTQPAPTPRMCSHCRGSGWIGHQSGRTKPYPCPQCNGSEEVSFLRRSLFERKPMTDDERLEWCKQRALEYLDQHDVKNAIGSMMSDMYTYNVGTKNGSIAMLGILIASRDDEVEARRWIVGFR